MGDTLSIGRGPGGLRTSRWAGRVALTECRARGGRFKPSRPGAETHRVQTPATVVVTDVARPADLARCVQQVRRSVPRGVEVVVVTAAPRRLPPALARAVRVVRVEDGTAFTTAVTAEAERDRLVVVARSDARVTGGWFAAVADRVAAAPDVPAALGGDDPHLLVFPALVRSTALERTAWEGVEGVGLVGGSGRPAPARTTTISASLIVKDEEEVIGACLTALEGVVDEVVVYDTGSTDRTVEIARAHGAQVHLGYWDDHFGDARNRALEHSTCEWVLHVDADEVLTGDGAALRARLAAESADLVRVVVVSTSWKDATEGFESRPIRLFRRERFRWTGALHEYVEPLPGVLGVTVAAEVADVRLLHSGYQRVTFSEKDKHTRNVEIARAATEGVPDGSPHAATVWSNYGRALTGAGRGDEALEAFAHLLHPGGNPTAVVSGARAAVGLLLDRRRFDDVDRWLEVMAQRGEAPGNLALVRARRRFAQGDHDGAAAELDGIAAGDRDLWGAPHDAAAVRRLRVRIARDRGATSEALDLLHRELAEHPEVVDLALLLGTSTDAGAGLGDLAARAPDVFVARSLREVFGLPAGLAMTWLEALHAARPGDVAVLAAGSVAAAAADITAALAWSVRAREAGHPQVCALRRYALAEHRHPVDAALAWALLADAFGEDDARQQLNAVTAAMGPADRATLAGHLTQLTPDLVEALA